ncbi:PREDICTED: protein unc-79 homolog isoform X2 [Priapulus caudatus]|uniref:Protein unc-79 homolog isoform X2 n=1 Tax=Priapulus caudatus TaxID=37621 RepID=A0ABM1DZ57_PRICU|nr:PREDICTED: protein unc-79 homolog isoform X2 [Priapulus caudatus]
MSVASQCLRTVLHQMSSFGIFLQLFQSSCEDEFFQTICGVLADFNELNQWAPLVNLLEALNDKNTRISDDKVVSLLHNMAVYMECMPLEGGPWNNILSLFDVFFRALPGMLPSEITDMTDTFRIIASVLKIPGLSQQKSILEPFSKLISFTIQNCAFKLNHLMELCLLCNRAFTKERDRLLLSRAAVFELVQALKFKTVLPDENLLLLVQLVVLDAGGTLSPTNVAEELFGRNYDPHTMISTNAADCMKHNLTDCIEFISDLHTISKVKSNMKGGSNTALNEDTLGGLLKAGISQYVALEFTRSSSRDFRAHNRYLPWLYHPPSAMQQGPKEFTDCIAHIRMLSWLLLGSLTHSAMTQSQGSILCQPIPIEASTHIADHVLVILTGFAEQSKQSVLHMSSLFHTFILCQLWTMYCEQMALMNPPQSEEHVIASVTILDFWGRVTPGVLQLLSHSKVLAEMVNLHFLSLIEALQECNSTVLSKFFPMWGPVLHCYHSQLPGQMLVRLQNCQNWIPPVQTKEELAYNSTVLLHWLKRLQFKMGQIEMQSSAATQFYTV